MAKPRPPRVPKNDPRLKALAQELGIKPKQARAVINAYTGGYKGADFSRDALAGWHIARGTPDELIGRDRPNLIRAHGDLNRNHPLVAGMTSNYALGVVGTGLSYHAAIDREYLGLEETYADAWEVLAEFYFGLWAASKDCDVRRSLDFYQQQDLALREELGGDHFVQLCQVQGRGLPFKLALQHIAGARVCNPNQLQDSPTLVQGVEKDTQGAPLIYHVMDGYPDGQLNRGFTWTPLPVFNAQTNRRNVLHLYRTLNTDQTRGVPLIAPIVEPLKQLDRYTDAELDAAVKNAMWAILVKSPTGGQLAGCSNLDEWDEQRRCFYQDSNIHMKSGTSHVVNLFPDDDIASFDPSRPNAAFDPFVQSFWTVLGMGLELPRDVLTGAFQSSYSAARAAILRATAVYGKRRVDLAGDLCDPVKESFIDEMVAYGYLPAPGYFADPFVRAAYNGAQWIGDAAGQLDETKAVVAAEARVALGISTRKDECTALTGKDYDKVRRQWEKEQRQGAPAPWEKTAAAPARPAPESDEDLDRADREEEKKARG
jgi:lambda family phage portal protein